MEYDLTLNQEHVILKCCAYNNIRIDLFTSAARSSHRNVYNVSDDDKLSLILSKMNNYIVRSYIDVIAITKYAIRRDRKAQSIVMY